MRGLYVVLYLFLCVNIVLGIVFWILSCDLFFLVFCFRVFEGNFGLRKNFINKEFLFLYRCFFIF